MIGPDADDHVTLRISNPTGTAPHAAEFHSTRKGWGYGTYAVVVEGNLSSMHKNLVFGGLFTYDDSTAPRTSHGEIEVSETSAWGADGAVVLDYTYFRDNPDTHASSGLPVRVVSEAIPSAPIMTHMMRWEAGRLRWWSWIGEGIGGRPFRSGEATAEIAIPNREAIVFNLWDFRADGFDIRLTDVKLRDFSFVPLGEEAGLRGSERARSR